jgi:hypothetical protein
VQNGLFCNALEMLSKISFATLLSFYAKRVVYNAFEIISIFSFAEQMMYHIADLCKKL